VADDGRPNATATATWSQVSGPASVTFADATSPGTSITVPQPGTYVLRLSATDGELSASDDVVVTAAAGVCAAPLTGLVGWWPGDASGTDVASGYNLVLRNGASFADGRVGPALAFDGFDDFATAGKPATVSDGDFTVDTWVLFHSLRRPPRVGSSGGGQMSLVDKMSPAAANRDGWRLLKHDDDTFWFCFGGGTADGCQAGGPLTVQSSTKVRPEDLDTWFHVTAVKSGDQVSLYVNGALEASKLLGRAFTDTGAGELVLGSNLFGQHTLDGLLDEVQVYNRALSAAEVQQLALQEAAGQCKPPRPASNQAPQVNAGADATILAAAEAGAATVGALNGAVADDGLPGGPLGSTWTKVSGSGTVTFADAAQPRTTATFSLPGTYVLRLSATDTQLTASDDVTVTVGAAACQTPTSGLVAWWPADGTGRDLIGGGAAVPQNGTIYVPGKVLEAFSFDGVDDQVNAGHAANLNVSAGDFSVDAWVFFKDVLGERTILDKMSATGTNTDGWRLMKSDGNQIWFCLGGDTVNGCAAGGPLTVQGTTQVKTGLWYHVAAVKRGTIISVYVNGVREASKALGASFTDSGQADLIFGAQVGQATSLSAWLDEVDLYGRALTDTEVRSIYAAGQLGKCKPNQPPRVNAGVDQIVHLLPSTGVPTTTTLMGIVADDGLPTPAQLTKTWTRVSGPANVTFGNASAATTTASFTLAGDYVLRLTVSDGQLTASDDLIVTVTSPVPNAAPIVNCGADQTVFGPSLRVNITCTVSDDGQPIGANLVPTWTKVDGPSTFEFINTGLTFAAINIYDVGTYTVRLRVSDGVLAGSDDVVVKVLPANKIPVVNPGPTQTVYLPQDGSVTTRMAGSATDDGQPTPPALTATWSLMWGPTPNNPDEPNYVFGDPHRFDTTVTLTQIGWYAFRLQVSDGLIVNEGSMSIYVEAGNRRPAVNAGPDQAITLPTRSVMLAGSRTDDGLPTGAALTSRWSVVSGPGAAVFSSPLSLVTSATFDSPGTYVLRLTVDDTELAGSDDLIVTVAGKPTIGDPPVVAITEPGDLTNVTAPVDVRGATTGTPSPPAARR
jgi:hypothetical protein